MQRMNQIREVIWERQGEDRRRDLSVREVELKTLASYIAGSAGHKQGVKSAERIRLLPDEPSQPGQVPERKMIPYGAAKAWFGA